MSTIDRLNTSTGVSRRTVVRGIAWTAPAVSIAVAAPAYAAVSPLPISGTATSTTIVRDTVSNEVVWTISFTNNGTTPLTNLQAVFSGVTFPTALSVTSDPGDVLWSGSGTSTRTYPSTLGAGETITIVATFSRSDNPKGTATATFSSSPETTGSIAVSAAYK